MPAEMQSFRSMQGALALTTMTKVPIVLIHIAHTCAAKDLQVVMGTQKLPCAWAALHRHTDTGRIQHAACASVRCKVETSTCSKHSKQKELYIKVSINVKCDSGKNKKVMLPIMHY